MRAFTMTSTRKVTVGAAGLLVLTLMAAVPAFAQQKPDAKPDDPEVEATHVVVNAVRLEPLSQTVPVLGRFVARQAGVIAARVEGSIADIRVDVGDRVKEGDVLAVLVKDRLQWRHNLQRAEVTHYTAQLKTKKQEIKLLRQELKRLKSLKKSPAFSQARLDDKHQEVAVAESAAAEAAARLSMANANLKLTGINLRDAEIRAPYSGVVSKRHADVGAYVDVGAPLVTVLDNETMEIEADVPAERIAGLKPHTRIPATFDGGKRIITMVRAVVPDENPQTRTRAVRFMPLFQNGAADVAANQSVTLLLPAAGRRQVMTVHKDAVITRQGKRLVVLAEDGKAQFRTVTLGEATGSRFIVKDGLATGDLVVVRGNERLLPGTPIRFDMPAPAAAGTDNGAGKEPAK